MDRKGEFVYIMYPVPIEVAQKMSLPFLHGNEKVSIPTDEEQDFVPLWYGNARFPEDEIY